MQKYLFRMKHFSVRHRLSAMKVGVDAVLLGAWVKLTAEKHLLDAGCGCGIISLMLAQRTPPSVRIDAIDTSPLAIIECKQNFEESPWHSRLRAYRADFQQLSREYSHIISNPPFFRAGIEEGTSSRLIARHASSLSPLSLITHGTQLLTPSGRISMICPPLWLDELTLAAAGSSLLPERICEVYDRPGREAKRLMLTFIKAESPIACKRETLYLRTPEGVYTPEYRALTRDFYL